MNKIIAILVLLLVLLSVGWYAYDFVSTTIANNIKLEQAAEANLEALNKLQEKQKELQTANTELQKSLKASTDYQNNLQNKLREHDLKSLSLRSPKVVEERINRATSKIFADIESDTAN